MPIHEPDETDPLELRGVGWGDVSWEETAFMARCLAEEFLQMGRSAKDVLALFRSPEYALAHRAWLELGEVRIFALVSGIAARGVAHA
jgi:hypothetical protein